MTNRSTQLGRAVSGPSFGGGLDFGAVVAAGRRVALRHITPADYPAIHEAETVGERTITYRNRGTTPPPESFAAGFWNAIVCQFLIVDKQDGTPLGVASCFHADFRNGHARLGALLFPTASGIGWPLEGFGLFVSHVFRAFPFRKLYADMLEPNAESFGHAFASILRIESRLEEHEFYNGEYVALLTGAIYRRDWEERTSRRAVWADKLRGAQE